jgi:hypothetical protein
MEENPTPSREERLRLKRSLVIATIARIDTGSHPLTENPAVSRAMLVEWLEACEVELADLEREGPRDWSKIVPALVESVRNRIIMGNTAHQAARHDPRWLWRAFLFQKFKSG